MTNLIFLIKFYKILHHINRIKNIIMLTTFRDLTNGCYESYLLMIFEVIIVLFDYSLIIFIKNKVRIKLVISLGHLV